MRAASARQLGKPIGEITESRAARNRNQPESGSGNTSACVQPIQQQHQPTTTAIGMAMREVRIAIEEV
jgi:hypothetical protein